MRKPIKYVQNEPTVGQTRIKRVFAFFPIEVGAFVVWLEWYEVLEGYVKEDFLLYVDGVDKGFRLEGWRFISKRVMDNKVDAPTANLVAFRPRKNRVA